MNRMGKKEALSELYKKCQIVQGKKKVENKRIKFNAFQVKQVCKIFHYNNNYFLIEYELAIDIVLFADDKLFILYITHTDIC